jgi:polyhydroxybutyrate depolymerase
MVVALHGGMGNARFMQEHLKMDGIAEKNGFIVADLNGSPATSRLPDTFHAWNVGGGCYGEPYTNTVDDIGYITGAVQYLERRYGVDPAHIFGDCPVPEAGLTIPWPGPLIRLRSMLRPEMDWIWPGRVQ